MSTDFDRKLIAAAFNGDILNARKAFDAGANVNAIDKRTGLAALHIAVGANDLGFARFLVEEANAQFFADGFGRMPSIVAIDCRADDDVFNFIAEKEAAVVAPRP